MTEITARHVRPAPRAARRRLTRAAASPLLWVVGAMGLAAAIVRQAIRPITWRRPVRAEFVRFMHVAGWQSLTAVLVTAVLLGLSLVAQALYWLARVGEGGTLLETIGVVLVREIAPLVVGLLVIGRGGIMMLSELSATHRAGQDHALDAMGIDPFLLFVVPRAVALAVSLFSLTILLVFVTFLSGFLTASIANLTSLRLLEFVSRMLQTIGSAGYLILPLKTIVMGLSIGSVCALTAMERMPTAAQMHEIIPTGFLRSVLTVFLISAIFSLIL